MLASEVRPNNCKTEDPLVTGKKRKARHMFPTRPRVRPELANLASHLQNGLMSEITFKTTLISEIIKVDKEIQ